MKNDRALADRLEALDRELEERQRPNRPRPTTGFSIPFARHERPLAAACIDRASGATALPG